MNVYWCLSCLFQWGKVFRIVIICPSFDVKKKKKSNPIDKKPSPLPPGGCLPSYWWSQLRGKWPDYGIKKPVDSCPRAADIQERDFRVEM